MNCEPQLLVYLSITGVHVSHPTSGLTSVVVKSVAERLLRQLTRICVSRVEQPNALPARTELFRM